MRSLSARGWAVVSALGIVVIVAIAWAVTPVPSPPPRPLCSAEGCTVECGASGCPWQSPFSGAWNNTGCQRDNSTPVLTLVPPTDPPNGTIRLGLTSTCGAGYGGVAAGGDTLGLNSPTFSAWKATGDPYTIVVNWSVEANLSAAVECNRSNGPITSQGNLASVTFLTTVNIFDFTRKGNPDPFAAETWKTLSVACSGPAASSGVAQLLGVLTQTAGGFAIAAGDTICVSAGVGLALTEASFDGNVTASASLAPDPLGAYVNATLVEVQVR